MAERTPLDPQTIAERHELIRSFGSTLGQMIQSGRFLLPDDRLWYPSDLVVPGSEEQIAEEARELPDHFIVIEGGVMVTEDALPNYLAILTRNLGTTDFTGTDSLEMNPWAVWDRGWTAEEKRHGLVVRDYIRASRRINVKALDRSTASLIRNGTNIKAHLDPYYGIFFPAEQELGTRKTHNNTGTVAAYYGALILARLCRKVGSDEGRHYQTYREAGKYIFQEDPAGAVISFIRMVRDHVPFPGAYMTDGEHAGPPQVESNLFHAFSAVTHTAGVYTAGDYLDNLAELAAAWDIEHLRVTGKAAQAQESIMRMAGSDRERANERLSRAYNKSAPNPTFAWINGRHVPLEDIGNIFDSRARHEEPEIEPVE